MSVTHFWSHLEGYMHVEPNGAAVSWAAPVARLVAPSGFDESCWLGEMPDTVIAVRLAGAHVVKVKGARAGASTAAGGNFTLQPRGSDNCFVAAGRSVFGHIHLSPTLIERAGQAAGKSDVRGCLRDDLVFCDDRDLTSLALTYVHRALETREPPTGLEMEARALLLLDALLRRHGGGSNPTHSRGGLSSWQLRLVTDYIAANFDKDLMLDDLSALTDLSAKHFARAFRQSTGLPPHRWLIQVRIERAQELLVESRQAISEIALACGFADQSHFTSAFRKAVGVTPGRFRSSAAL